MSIRADRRLWARSRRKDRGPGWGMEKRSDKAPHEKRRGRLKNGNPVGDLNTAPRCGAKTRRGARCQCPSMANGRCRLHGGLSTGPKTAEGRERSRRAALKHGRYTAAAKAEKKYCQKLLKECRAWLARIGDVANAEVGYDDRGRPPT
ncbi:MAG: HGGxSTG domain-containing protein [Bryobacteraceae bacterium]